MIFELCSAVVLMLRSMVTIDRAWRSIFSSWDCPRISTSHLQSQSDAKNLFSLVFESAVHKCKIAIQCLLVSVHKAFNFLVFESFPWLSIIQKRFVELSPMILQAPLAFDSDLLRIMPLILCLNFFGCPERGLSSTLKSPSLKRRNHSLHDLSVETVS